MADRPLLLQPPAEGYSPSPRPVMNGNLGPFSYTQDEAMAANYDGSLYPNGYDLSYRPVNATAYSRPTMQRLEKMYKDASVPAYPSERAAEQLSYNDFLRQNQQHISPADTTDMMSDDLTANRSALAALALKLRGTDILTGSNVTPVYNEGKLVGNNLGMTTDYPRMVRSAQGQDETGFSVRLHELMHSVMIDMKNNEPDPMIKKYLETPDGQHEVMASLGKRLFGTDDSRYGKAPPEIVDAIQNRALALLKPYQNPMGPR